MGFDFVQGTPRKLKSVSVEEIERRFSQVVAELVGDGAKISCDITNIDFNTGSPLMGSVAMNVIFERDSSDLEHNQVL